MYNTIKNDGFMNAPPCPSSHPIRMPQVTYETVWDTTKFNSLWTSGENPFVWSFHGNSGYGIHADYLFGWKGDALQRAMDKSECFYDGCGSITKQAMSVANQCKVKDQVGENIDGCKFSSSLSIPLISPLTVSRGCQPSWPDANVTRPLAATASIGSSRKEFFLSSSRD